jgi:hypothetical protein
VEQDEEEMPKLPLILLLLASSPCSRVEPRDAAAADCCVTLQVGRILVAGCSLHRLRNREKDGPPHFQLRKKVKWLPVLILTTPRKLPIYQSTGEGVV